MNIKTKKSLQWPLLAAVTGMVLAILRGGNTELNVPLPFLTAFGQWLRRLSLGSSAGNAAAWIIVLTLAILPLAAMLPLRRRGGWSKVDLLLPLLSLLIFTLCYYLVNPTLLPSPAGSFFPWACAGSILSVAVAWAALRGLRALDASPAERLSAVTRPLLIVWAALLAFSACWERTSVFLSRWSDVAAGNTAGGYSFTVFILAVVAVLTLIPDLLAALTLLWGAELVGALGDLTFSPETVALCRHTAHSCRRVTAAAMLIAVVTNLLQLTLLGILRSTYFSMVIPVMPLVLSVALYLLCRCLQRGKELQDDSDSII